MPDKKQIIDSLILNGEETILYALKKMDILERKLLMVINEGKFTGLVSIGDIQRAIIRNLPLETKVKQILRDDIRIAYTDEKPEQIKATMMEFRTEIMPLLDRQNNLVDVLFWEDMFLTAVNKTAEKINLPVVIMAGGEGARLKPLTNVLPKPLVPIGEKSIIENIMDRFVDAGCDRFLLSVNYKADMIQHYLSSLQNTTYHIEYFREDKPLGTAGPLSLVNGLDDTFLVANGDVLTTLDLQDLVATHQKSGAIATIASHSRKVKIDLGVLQFEGSDVLKGYIEKPEYDFFVSMGIYVFEPAVLDYIPYNQYLDFPDLVLRLIENKERVMGYRFNGYWQDLGRLEDYEQAVQDFDTWKPKILGE